MCDVIAFAPFIPCHILPYDPNLSLMNLFRQIELE